MDIESRLQLIDIENLLFSYVFNLQYFVKEIDANFTAVCGGHRPTAKQVNFTGTLFQKWENTAIFAGT